MEEPKLFINIMNEAKLLQMKRRKNELLLKLEANADSHCAENDVDVMIVQFLSQEIAILERDIQKEKDKYYENLEIYRRSNRS